MEISAELLEEILAHARAEEPNECCGVVGVLASSDGAPMRAMRVVRAKNIHESPKRFEIDGLDVMRAERDFEETGWQIGAIYHSHTHTAPYPSQTDINFARLWPGVEWIIVGLASPEPDIRSYLIEDGDVREVALAQASVL